MNIVKEQEFILNIIAHYLFDKSFAMEQYESLDYKYIYRIVLEQKLEGIVFYALEKLQCKNKLYEALKQRFIKCVVISTNQELEYQQMIAILSKNTIDYVPLKGIFMKQYYPHPEMRLMGDIDILIPYAKRDEVKNLLLQSNYSNEEDEKLCAHHDIYAKDKYGHFEMHFRLLDEESSSRDYLDAICWNETINHRFSNEFNIVYLLAHYANHFSHGGASFKSMIDIALLLKKETINKDKLLFILEKTNYLSFFNSISQMINYIFGIDVLLFNQKLSLSEMDKIINYIFKCGDFGFGKDNDFYYQRTLHDFSKIKKVGIFAKINYIVKLICLPYRKFKYSSKIIKYCPILLPFGWLFRLVKYCFTNKKRMKEKLVAIKKVSPDDVNDYKLINKFLNE